MFILSADLRASPVSNCLLRVLIYLSIEAEICRRSFLEDRQAMLRAIAESLPEADLKYAFLVRAVLNVGLRDWDAGAGSNTSKDEPLRTVGPEL